MATVRSQMEKLLGTLTTTYNEIFDLALSEEKAIKEAKESGEDSEEELDLFGGVQLLTPAMLTSAANFLKQNDVTAQEEEGDSMSELARKLKEKQQKGRNKLKAVSH